MAGSRREDSGRLRVAGVREMDAILRELLASRGCCRQLREEIDQASMLCRCQIADGLGVDRERRIAGSGIGRFEAVRRDQHEPHIRRQEIVAELLQLLPKVGQPRLTPVRLVAAVGDEYDRGLEFTHEGEHPLVALCRLVKNATRLRPDGVATPAEVTKRERGIGMARDERRLDEAAVTLPLDERVAEKHDPVAIAKRPVTLWRPGGGLGWGLGNGGTGFRGGDGEDGRQQAGSARAE